MLEISGQVAIPDEEIDMQAIRAQGAGGQNVNKVSSAIHLRFDIRASSLPDEYKERLLQWRDQRISSDGIIIIKAQQHRSQEKNRGGCLEPTAGVDPCCHGCSEEEKADTQDSGLEKTALGGQEYPWPGKVSAQKGQ